MHQHSAFQNSTIQPYFDYHMSSNGEQNSVVYSQGKPTLSKWSRATWVSSNSILGYGSCLRHSAVSQLTGKVYQHLPLKCRATCRQWFGGSITVLVDWLSCWLLSNCLYWHTNLGISLYRLSSSQENYSTTLQHLVILNLGSQHSHYFRRLKVPNKFWRESCCIIFWYMNCCKWS